DALLDARPDIQAKVDIAIARPAEIISMLDGVVREADYQPRRFEGSLLSIFRPSATEERDLVNTYLDSSSGETKARLLQAIRSLYSRSDTAQILEVRDHEH